MTSGATSSRASSRGWIWGPWSRLGLGLALATIVADQAHKWWMISVYRIGERVRVPVTPFFDLVYVKNLGISYGVASGQFAQWALAAFALLAAVALNAWLARGAANGLMAAGLGLIIGGALANGIDRVHLGGVADFFSLHAFGFYWYVFNVADAAIVAGVAGLVYDSLSPGRKGAAKAP
jgi:signal peptidase II